MVVDRCRFHWDEVSKLDESGGRWAEVGPKSWDLPDDSRDGGPVMFALLFATAFGACVGFLVGVIVSGWW